jgi:hypothetical protein
MSKKPEKEPSVPSVTQKDVNFQKWISRAYGFAGLCLGLLALAEAFGFASTILRSVTMIGIVLAGTGAWIMQSKRTCPNCGSLYGYAIRIVNANLCRKCGADFPPWRPGDTEDNRDDLRGSG